jgi:hypothetical protein
MAGRGDAFQRNSMFIYGPEVGVGETALDQLTFELPELALAFHARLRKKRWTYREVSCDVHRQQSSGSLLVSSEVDCSVGRIESAQIKFEKSEGATISLLGPPTSHCFLALSSKAK